jgi:hypothetical protein
MGSSQAITNPDGKENFSFSISFIFNYLFQEKQQLNHGMMK